MVAKGAKRIVVDYNSASSLSTALRGVDVVVSALNRNPEATGSQEALARASKEAGVKIFVPSDFGSPTEGSGNSVYVQKDTFKNKFLRELDLPYAIFYTGPFSDFALAPCVSVVFVVLGLRLIMITLSLWGSCLVSISREGR